MMFGDYAGDMGIFVYRLTTAPLYKVESTISLIGLSSGNPGATAAAWFYPLFPYANGTGGGVVTEKIIPVYQGSTSNQALSQSQDVYIQLISPNQAEEPIILNGTNEWLVVATGGQVITSIPPTHLHVIGDGTEIELP